jgi:hypothetical protein
MHPGRICSEGDNKSLLKIKERSYERNGRPGGSQKQREKKSSLCFKEFLKKTFAS